VSLEYFIVCMNEAGLTASYLLKTAQGGDILEQQNSYTPIL